MSSHLTFLPATLGPFVYAKPISVYWTWFGRASNIDAVPSCSTFMHRLELALPRKPFRRDRKFRNGRPLWVGI
ncbi:hypothetical protein EX30DRAFT_340267 [Ascodesmis nigricans]|uniref:Uncharacterized protein n=1 Tax=Ascodesmis nigricans TaxID=341454 RepID=A0A4S2MYJ7_9PEZI|nr:hypothetical protein EX30DRAFT_340267 [Ascodesmis nigricans]